MGLTFHCQNLYCPVSDFPCDNFHLGCDNLSDLGLHLPLLKSENPAHRTNSGLNVRGSGELLFSLTIPYGVTDAAL